MPSIFSRIIAGEVPGAFVFRGPRWVALLDIRPTAVGHCLLIPVFEAAQLDGLPAEVLAEAAPLLARLTTTVRRATGCPAVNVVLNDGPAAGQEVPHVHFHVIPRMANDGRGYRFAPQPDPNAAATAAALRAAWEAL
jgi:histidine triad (HIT) family protein